MQRWFPPLGSLLCLLLLAGLALAIARADLPPSRPVERAPIYTVATLQAHLARGAGAWLARPLQVAGVVTYCGPLKPDSMARW